MQPVMLQVPLGPWLFDLERDPDESYDVSDRNLEQTERMAALLAERVAADRLDVRGFRVGAPGD